MKLTRLPVAIGLFLLTGQLYATAMGREVWPFTCAPMFAQELRPDAPIYVLTLEIVRPGGAVPVTFQQLGLRARHQGRLLFAAVYGSADPSWPVWPRPVDDRAALEGRLSAWMSGLMDLVQARQPALARGATGILLGLDEIDPAGRRSARALGHWSRESGRYVHTWSGDGP